MYGLMIALGVILGLELARRRWAARGGDPDDMYAIAMWAVPAGLIGARLYHVITDNELYRGGNWYQAFFIWNGGLGIPGGIIAGVGVGVGVARRRGIRIPTGLDVVAPSLALAQAIGRWGNYFNQELFGRPTTVPWGLEVDPAHRPPGLEQFATFHPTFLYEMVWNLALVCVLVLIDRRRVLRPGRIFALYVGGYFLGRLWVEALRSDEANKILGLRVNIWTSLIAIAGVGVLLAVGGLRRRPDDIDDPYDDGHHWSPERPGDGQDDVHNGIEDQPVQD